MRALAFSFILLVVLAFASCVSPGEYVRRATAVAPDGTVPAATIVRKAPGLAGSPADVDAWLEVVKALGYIVLGAGGKTGVDAVRKKKAVA